MNLINIFISWHTTSSTFFGLESILATPGPEMREYCVSYGLTILFFAYRWLHIKYTNTRKRLCFNLIFQEIFVLLTFSICVCSTLHFTSWQTCVIWLNRSCQMTGTSIFLMAFKTSIVCPHPRIESRTEVSGT